MTTGVATVGNQYVTGWGGGRKEKMGVGGNGWFVRGGGDIGFLLGRGWIVARWGAIKGCRFVRAEKKRFFCSVFSKSTNSFSSYVSEFPICFPFLIFFFFFSSS